MVHARPALPLGRDDPISGTDCSGFVSGFCARSGQSARKRVDDAQPVAELPGPRGESQPHQPGHILLFSSNGGVSGINHTGIAIGNGAMIEAGGGDSSTTSDDQASKQNAFVRVRPIRKTCSPCCESLTDTKPEKDTNAVSE